MLAPVFIGLAILTFLLYRLLRPRPKALLLFLVLLLVWEGPKWNITDRGALLKPIWAGDNLAAHAVVPSMPRPGPRILTGNPHLSVIGGEEVTLSKLRGYALANWMYYFGSVPVGQRCRGMYVPKHLLRTWYGGKCFSLLIDPHGCDGGSQLFVNDVQVRGFGPSSGIVARILGFPEVDARQFEVEEMELYRTWLAHEKQQAAAKAADAKDSK